MNSFLDPGSSLLSVKGEACAGETEAKDERRRLGAAEQSAYSSVNEHGSAASGNVVYSTSKSLLGTEG